MTAWLKIVGLGPGNEAMITSEVHAALADATDALGYFPYVNRISERPGLTLHASDNREELSRAKQALELVEAGKKVVMLSSGDPGVFAMASAVFEVVDTGKPSWRELEIKVLPGITAMLAVSASVGAPLGHDFCCINLSDNLKPWSLIENRVRAAASVDLAMAFYNPRSKSRPAGFGKILNLLSEACERERVLIFAKDVTTPKESILITTLGEATEEMADMRTLVIIGSSKTRIIDRSGNSFVYTPRCA
ncbi:MAG: precorrin-3B C(17)-methyltransferase [Coxiella sp. RIFCSPHIGHO2_12_FULL_44_14]|nr:MAG: precorrin-3B C(17)-methyltransferase [Coxiella sp. RIFCSPHIGHO2_12_FULL_44_14]